jgi:hypothetical protein
LEKSSIERRSGQVPDESIGKGGYGVQINVSASTEQYHQATRPTAPQIGIRIREQTPFSSNSDFSDWQRRVTIEANSHQLHLRRYPFDGVASLGRGRAERAKDRQVPWI